MFMCAFRSDDFIEKIKQRNTNKNIKVLDLCSGKGGDLKKWKNAGVVKVILAGELCPGHVQHEKSF